MSAWFPQEVASTLSVVESLNHFPIALFSIIAEYAVAEDRFIMIERFDSRNCYLWDASAKKWARRSGDWPTDQEPYIHYPPSHSLLRMKDYVYLANSQMFGRFQIKSGSPWVPIHGWERPRNHVTLASFNGCIYLLGGIDSGNAGNLVDVYDPISNKWTKGPPMLTARRDGCCCVVLQRSLYVFGGMNLDDKHCERLGPDGWVSIGESIDARSYGMAVAISDTKAWILDGRDETDYIDTVEEFDCTTNSFTILPWSLSEEQSMSSAHFDRASGTLFLAGSDCWCPRDPSFVTRRFSNGKWRGLPNTWK